MGVITNSIGTGSRDFSTIQGWHDALPANLVTDGNSYVGELYADGGSFAASEFTAAGTIVTFSGRTTDATHTITLKCAAGQSFRDQAGVQSNPLKYDASKGIALRGNTSGYSHVIVISNDGVHLDGLQVKNDTTGLGGGCSVRVTTAGVTHTDINNCILEGSRHGATTGFGSVEFLGGTLRNCLILQRDTGRGVSVGYPDAGLLIINCTIVRPSDVTAANDGIEAASGTNTVKSCAVFGFTNFVNNSARFTGSNNASDTTIGFGSSNQASKTYGNQFQNTVDATRDFRLKAGADCIDTGVTDSTNAPIDIAGTSRPSGSAYDIGAWEFVASTLTAAQELPAFLQAMSGCIIGRVDA